MCSEKDQIGTKKQTSFALPNNDRPPRRRRCDSWPQEQPQSKRLVWSWTTYKKIPSNSTGKALRPVVVMPRSSVCSGISSITSHGNNNNTNQQQNNTQQQPGRLTAALTLLIVIMLVLLVQLDMGGNSTATTPIMTISEGAAAAYQQRQKKSQQQQHHEEEEEETVIPLKRGKILLNNERNDRLIATDMYNAYQEIKLDYEEKAFAAINKNKWKLLKKKDGVQVSILNDPSDPLCPYVKLETIFPTSISNCWDFLGLSNWDKNMPKMDRFYEGVTIYGEYTHKKVHMSLVRKRSKRLFTFGKRDFSILSVTDEPLKDGTWVSGTVSVRTNIIPRSVGYTRAFYDSVSFYAPVEKNTNGYNNKNTRLSIVGRMDLNDSNPDGSGGWIPMWLYVKTIGTTGVRSITRMRNALQENLQVKQQ